MRHQRHIGSAGPRGVTHRTGGAEIYLLYFTDDSWTHIFAGEAISALQIQGNKSASDLTSGGDDVCDGRLGADRLVFFSRLPGMVRSVPCCCVSLCLGTGLMTGQYLPYSGYEH